MGPIVLMAVVINAAPQRRNPGGRNVSNRFFFGNNNAANAGAAGAAAGFANQIFNPCRGGTRNRGTNNKILGGSSTFNNGLLGFIGGYAAGQLLNNAQGSPCGK